MLWTFKLNICLPTLIFGMQSTVLMEKNERKALGSYFKNMMRELGIQRDSSERQFQCRWNCQINESDLVYTTIMTVLAEGRKLSLAFHYEKILEDDCVNRTTRRSDQNATEYWQVWLVNNTFPSFCGNQFIRGFSALIQASFEDQVKVLCRFRKTNFPGKETLYGELSSLSEHLANILRLTVEPIGELCDAQSKNDAQICIQISKFNHDARWKDSDLQRLIIAFVIAFTYIGPAVVCLYSAREDTCDGICRISVEGPSPVGFWSLIGNFFFFSTGYTIWHRARKFIMHVVLFPVPF